MALAPHLIATTPQPQGLAVAMLGAPCWWHADHGPPCLPASPPPRLMPRMEHQVVMPATPQAPLAVLLKIVSDQLVMAPIGTALVRW
jgi:hypothetical protein